MVGDRWKGARTHVFAEEYRPEKRDSGLDCRPTQHSAQDDAGPRDSVGTAKAMSVQNDPQNLAFRRLYVSSSDSGSTRVSPTTVMKLASATQRGRTCM